LGFRIVSLTLWIGGRCVYSEGDGHEQRDALGAERIRRLTRHRLEPRLRYERRGGKPPPYVSRGVCAQKRRTGALGQALPVDLRSRRWKAVTSLVRIDSHQSWKERAGSRVGEA